MGSFFSLDGPFYKFGSILADIMILSILWLILCLPIVTAGAATSAVYFITTRKVSNKEGYLLKDFFRSFRQNFKQATLSWLLILLVGIILTFNIYYIRQGNFGDMGVYILPIQIGLLVELISISLYIFPVISRFELRFFEAFKTSFFMVNKHLLTTIVAVIGAFVSMLIVEIYPIYIFVAIGVYSYFMSYMFMRIYKKYRPDIDKDELDELRSVPD